MSGKCHSRQPPKSNYQLVMFRMFILFINVLSTPGSTEIYAGNLSAQIRPRDNEDVCNDTLIPARARCYFFGFTDGVSKDFLRG
jgi:hypothetical protein